MNDLAQYPVFPWILYVVTLTNNKEIEFQRQYSHIEIFVF
jgi:hypothetical protein